MATEFIAVQDEKESAKLQKFSGQLQDIEDHLPIDPKYRNPKLGALSPIVVVNEIFWPLPVSPRLRPPTGPPVPRSQIRRCSVSAGRGGIGGG